jgi:hypothetical protein
MSTPAVVSEPQPGLSEGARLINTFVAPSKTFTDIRRNASWWVPWLVISIVSIAFMQTVGAKIGWEQVTRNELQISGRAEKFDQAPPEQRAKGVQLSATIYKIAGYASPVTVLLATLVVGGILMALFNFGAGAEVTFKQSMAIVLYAWLPGILSSILGIVSVIVGSNSDSFKEGFNLRNPVATNPAYLMDPTRNKFLYGMASAADVFVIWIIILAGIGFSSVSKVKKGTAIGMIAGAYIVYKLIAAGLSAI